MQISSIDRKKGAVNFHQRRFSFLSFQSERGNNGACNSPENRHKMQFFYQFPSSLVGFAILSLVWVSLHDWKELQNMPNCVESPDKNNVTQFFFFLDSIACKNFGTWHSITLIALNLDYFYSCNGTLSNYSKTFVSLIESNNLNSDDFFSWILTRFWLFLLLFDQKLIWLVHFWMYFA